MFVSDILRDKGGEVISVGPEDSALSAARILSKRGIGSLLVLAGKAGTVLVHCGEAPEGLGLGEAGPPWRSLRGGSIDARPVQDAIEVDPIEVQRGRGYLLKLSTSKRDAAFPFADDAR